MLRGEHRLTEPQLQTCQGEHGKGDKETKEGAIIHQVMVQ